MVKKDVKKAQKPVASSHFLNDLQSSVNTTFSNYLKEQTSKLILIDSFLVFLVALGVIQFVFCLLVGNFPFNAFLAGFISAVGQFVLTVSLRLQYVSSNRKDFPSVTAKRAVGDYIFASLILHFIVYHFIN